MLHNLHYKYHRWTLGYNNATWDITLVFRFLQLSFRFFEPTSKERIYFVCNSLTTIITTRLSINGRIYGVVDKTLFSSVMWYETDGFRTRPFWDPKSVFVLVLQYGVVLWNTVLSYLEGQQKILSTNYSFSILCLEHHYCGDQQWCSLTWKLNPSSVFVYFRWSWSWS